MDYLEAAVMITGMISLLVALRLTNLTKRTKQKDRSIEEILALKDQALEEAKRQAYSFRAKVHRLEQGPQQDIERAVNDGDLNIESIADLYDSAPKWLKLMVSKDEVKSILSNLDVEALTEKVKGLRRSKDLSQPQDDTRSGL